MQKYLSSFFVLVFSAMLFPMSVSAQRLIISATPQNAPAFSRQEAASAQKDPGYFTISTDSVRVTLKKVSSETGGTFVQMQEPGAGGVDAVLDTIDHIINTASKIWSIVQQNAPVVNISGKYATAYPQGVTSAAQLAGWSMPKTYEYEFSANNLYGATMINCKYRVTFSYNGAYKGKGKFLTAVAVIPESVDVGWGYHFDMNADVPDSTIVNVGTDADPVAAMQLKLSWKMSTVLKEVDGTSVYYVQGNGLFNEIASPWQKGVARLQDVKAAQPLLDGVSFDGNF